MSAERVAVVTGGTAGIGKAVVELLRERGWTVYALSRSAEEGRFTRRCDVGDEASVARAFGSIGRVDALVTSAGVAHVGDSAAIPAADWEKVFKTNVLGTYLCARAVLPGMRERRFGRIVTLGSVAGRSYSKSASAAYTSSKYAVIGLTKQLAVAVARDGVTVNCVCPSQTLTEMLEKAVPEARRKELAAANPSGRLADPREVAEAVAALLTEGASYVNGAVLDVNGGML